MLALGRALMTKPRLVLLDELSIGLAPRISADFFGSIPRLGDAGIAALAIAEGHTRRAGLVFCGSASALANDQWII